MAKKLKKSSEQIEQNAKTFKLPYGPFQGRKINTVPRGHLQSLLDDKSFAKDLERNYNALFQTIRDWLDSMKGKPEESGEPKRQIEKGTRVSHIETVHEAKEATPGMETVK